MLVTKAVQVRITRLEENVLVRGKGCIIFVGNYIAVRMKRLRPYKVYNGGF